MDNAIGRTWKKEVVRKKNARALPFLPDEIIANIISRLSVKIVIRCRLVCKRWRDLTLIQDFVDLNLRHSLPMILVADFDDSDLNLIDKWWGPSRMIHRFPFDYSYFRPYNLNPLISQGGLIVFNELKQSGIVLFIVNPIYPPENVRITLSNVLRGSEIYGVFFHPSLKEYCSLWKIQASHEPWGQPSRIHYMMLTLGSNPSLKTVMVSNSLLNRVKKPTTHLLLIDNYLYWMLECQPNHFEGRNDIMKFDITSEEFMVIHCPVPLNLNTECRYNQTHLLNIDGILSFLLILPSKITIWRLKDHKEQQLWTTSEYILNIEICTSSFDRGIAVVSGKLAFLSNRILYICNLIEGTVKKCRKRKQRWWFIRLSHHMSLASLSNSKPTISIDQDQDNKVVVVVVVEE